MSHETNINELYHTIILIYNKNDIIDITSKMGVGIYEHCHLENNVYVLKYIERLLKYNVMSTEV